MVVFNIKGHFLDLIMNKKLDIYFNLLRLLCEYSHYLLVVARFQKNDSLLAQWIIILDYSATK